MVDEQLSSTLKKKVLIIRFSSLGDIVLTFPAIQLLKQNNYEIHYLTKDSFKELISLNADIDKVFTVQNHVKIKELIILIKQIINDENYTSVVDLHNNLRTFFIRLFLKSKSKIQVIKISKERIKTLLVFLLKSNITKFLKIECKRKILLNLELINNKIIMYNIFDVRNNFDARKYLDSQFINYKLSENSINKVNFEKPYVIISPDSLWKEKEWELNNFKKVAQFLKDKNYKIIWTASKKTKDLNIQDGVDLTGKTSLTELIYLVKNASLVISNDSGIMHIAESLGIRSISFFGPTADVLGFAPFRKTSLISESSLWCRPCSKSGKLCFRPIQRRLCLKNIKIDDVILNINTLMGLNENLDL